MHHDRSNVLGVAFEVVAVDTCIPVRTKETFLGLDVVVPSHRLLVFKTSRV